MTDQSDSAPLPDRERLDSLAAGLRSALANLGATVAIFDLDGRLVWANAAAARLLGPVEGRHFSELIASADRERGRAGFQRKLEGEAVVTDCEIAVLGAAGREVTLQVSSVPLCDGGRVVGALAFGAPRKPGVGDDAGPATSPLTPRQHEVLLLLGEGLTTREIAGRLGIAHETARNHIRAVLGELRCHSRLEAVVEARRRGLI